MNEKRAYKINEVSVLYGVGRTKIYGEIRLGRLMSYKVGRLTLVSHEAVEKWKRLCERESQREETKSGLEE